MEMPESFAYGDEALAAVPRRDLNRIWRGSQGQSTDGQWDKLNRDEQKQSKQPKWSRLTVVLLLQTIRSALLRTSMVRWSLQELMLTQQNGGPLRQEPTPRLWKKVQSPALEAIESWSLEAFIREVSLCLSCSFALRTCRIRILLNSKILRFIQVCHVSDELRCSHVHWGVERNLMLLKQCSQIEMLSLLQKLFVLKVKAISRSMPFPTIHRLLQALQTFFRGVLVDSCWFSEDSSHKARWDWRCKHYRFQTSLPTWGGQRLWWQNVGLKFPDLSWINSLVERKKSDTKGMRFCELIKEDLAALAELPESSQELEAQCPNHLRHLGHRSNVRTDWRCTERQA